MKMTNVFKDKPFYSKTNLNDMGYSWYQIDKFVKEGKLKKLNCHIYESTMYEDVVNDFSYVHVFVPDGVICQLSAAYYYGYTNYMPNSIDVSIPRNRKVSSMPIYPSIKLYYSNDKRYFLDILEIKTDSDHFKIYSKEKTVCDVLINRNKIESELVKEILKGYLNDKERDLNKLHKLSLKLKCDKILRTYLEVLL